MPHRMPQDSIAFGLVGHWFLVFGFSFGFRFRFRFRFCYFVFIYFFFVASEEKLCLPNFPR